MKKIIENIKKIYQKFPITNICLMIFGIIAAIFYNNSNETILENVTKVMIFIISFGLLSFLIESFKRKEIYLNLTNAVASGLITFIVSKYTNSSYASFIIFKFILVLYLAIFIIGFMANYKKSNVSLSKYCMSILERTILTSITVGLIYIGTTLIMYLISILLYSKIMNVWYQVIILITFVAYIPSLINNLKDIKEAHNFSKIIIAKVMNIISLIIYILIYIYIIKIMATQTKPIASIFTIISIVFIFSALISLLVKDNCNSKLLLKINSKIHYIFIPLLLVQCYSLYVRVGEYGLTEKRYVGVLLIAYELIYIIIKILNKKDDYNVYILLAMIIIFTQIPIINVHDLPLQEQSKYIKKYKENGNISEKTIEAYSYIEENDYSEKILKNILNDEEQNKLAEEATNYYLNIDNEIYGDSEYYNEDDIMQLYSAIDNQKINVDGYKNILILTLESSLDDYSQYNIDIDKITTNYIKHSDDFDNYFKNNHEFEYNKSKFVITEIYVYYTSNGSIDSYILSGYILTK